MGRGGGGDWGVWEMGREGGGKEVVYNVLCVPEAEAPNMVSVSHPASSDLRH